MSHVDSLSGGGNSSTSLHCDPFLYLLEYVCVLCMCICVLCVCLSVCLSVHMSVHTYVAIKLCN